MKKLEKQKKIYESMKISPKLNQCVTETIRKNTEIVKRKSYIRPILITVSSFCVAFIVLINISPDFANAAYQIPIVSKVAKIFTFREYKENNESELIKVKMPAISNTGNKALENKINEEIATKINLLLEDAKQRAKTYKEMVEEANDPEIEFHPTEIEINYELKYSYDKVISFVIIKSESVINYMEERYYYNINLETGKEITMQDRLGENYQERINDQIKKQISIREELDETASFFKDEDTPYLEHGMGFHGISENQDFYINEKGNVVIVFPKYSIAPGYMGILEFEIEE